MPWIFIPCRSFFALLGEKTTGKRRKVPCCRRLEWLLRKPKLLTSEEGDYVRMVSIDAD